MNTKITLSSASLVITFQVDRVTPALEAELAALRVHQDETNDGEVFLDSNDEHPEAEEVMGRISTSLAIQTLQDWQL